MALIKKYKNYFRISALIWSVCLVAFVLVYFLVISPEYRERNKIEKELAESRQDYEFARKAAQEDMKAKMNEEIRLLQGSLESFVLSYKSAADLTFDITRIAGQCKLSSFNIQSNDGKNDMASADPNNILEKNLKISFTAGFREFAMFLNMLERHQPVLFVKKFLLSRQNNDNTAYEVTLEIAALILKQQENKIKVVTAERKAGTEF